MDENGLRGINPGGGRSCHFQGEQVIGDWRAALAGDSASWYIHVIEARRGAQQPWSLGGGSRSHRSFFSFAWGSGRKGAQQPWSLGGGSRSHGSFFSFAWGGGRKGAHSPCSFVNYFHVFFSYVMLFAIPCQEEHQSPCFSQYSRFSVHTLKGLTWSWFHSWRKWELVVSLSTIELVALEKCGWPFSVRNKGDFQCTIHPDLFCEAWVEFRS